MRAFYNDIDRYCCDWLSNLMDAGFITPGKIDDRPVQELDSSDLIGFNRVHFFAGIGGWEYALNLANWGEWEAWTGSCPCQPLSGAGQRRGHADQRHLWPAFHRLIAECKPAVVFGEQVGGALGLEWLAGVRADLEGSGYACGCAALPACGVGAPHRRERLWFVGDAGGARLAPSECAAVERAGRRQEGRTVAEPGGSFRAGTGWLTGSDGKARRAQSGVRLLAHGIPARASKLRAYGNAIVPAVAAEFIAAYMEVALDHERK